MLRRRFIPMTRNRKNRKLKKSARHQFSKLVFIVFLIQIDHKNPSFELCFFTLKWAKSMKRANNSICLRFVNLLFTVSCFVIEVNLIFSRSKQFPVRNGFPRERFPIRYRILRTGGSNPEVSENKYWNWNIRIERRIVLQRR